MLRVLGLFSPFMRECIEMRFTWNRPYHVDATKFARRFWSDATPFEVGIPATIRAGLPRRRRPANNKRAGDQPRQNRHAVTDQKTDGIRALVPPRPAGG